MKVLVNDYKAEIDDSELAALPFISGFVGSCSFDLVRHEFPVLKQIELDDHPQHDAKFHMVEDVYVFDHYKEQLFIIATNLFSNQAESELKQRVQDRIDELKHITIYPEYKAHDLSNKQIEANMTQSEFEETVSAMKSLIQQGICSKSCHLLFIVIVINLAIIYSNYLINCIKI